MHASFTRAHFPALMEKLQSQNKRILCAAYH